MKNVKLIDQQNKKINKQALKLKTNTRYCLCKIWWQQQEMVVCKEKKFFPPKKSLSKHS